MIPYFFFAIDVVHLLMSSPEDPHLQLFLFCLDCIHFFYSIDRRRKKKSIYSDDSKE